MLMCVGQDLHSFKDPFGIVRVTRNSSKRILMWVTLSASTFPEASQRPCSGAVTTHPRRQVKSSFLRVGQSRLPTTKPKAAGPVKGPCLEIAVPGHFSPGHSRETCMEQPWGEFSCFSRPPPAGGAGVATIAALYKDSDSGTHDPL